MYTISESDQIKLDDILDHNDHPIYVNKDEIESFFDMVKLTFWSPSIGICSFCSKSASHSNIHVNIFSCDECMLILEGKEIDVMSSDDPVSVYLRTFLENWIDLNHWTSIDSESYFTEYDVKYNTCFICSNTIETGDVAIATDGKAVAHFNCAEDKGFRNYFNKDMYDEIITDLEIDEKIADLDTVPEYIPPIMQEDRDKLTQLISTLPAIDHSELDTFFGYLGYQHWVPISEIGGCTFCRYGCQYHNERLNLLSCGKCLNVIISDMIYITYPQNDVSYYARLVVTKWMNKNYFYPTNSHQVYNEYKVTYNTCQICKHCISNNELLGVAPDIIAHIDCIRKEGLSYEFRCDYINRVLMSGIIGSGNRRLNDYSHLPELAQL